jgi:cysteine-S-conjugate beta-lyase
MGRPRRHASGNELIMPDTKKRGFRTTLSHTGRKTKHEHGFVNPPLHRGSTVLVPTVADRQAMQAQRGQRVLSYGLGGSETHWALEDMMASVEGGTRCFVVCSGLAAVTTPLLAWSKAGDHCLMPDHVYGPARNFANGTLKRFGVETTFYPPEIDEAGIKALMRPNTAIVYTESPGSHTFEVQDITAIARAAHAGGAKVLMDNTWGIHHFQPFQHGVDVSIQAATKYPAGHSDILIGTVTVNNDDDWMTLHATARGLGQYASPDDCWLTLRGMRTLAIRLQAQMEAAIHVGHWLRQQPEVAQVLNPALPGAPGHEVWKRDFTGACSLFGVEFRPEFSVASTHKFVEALELFGIGASWGGYESLAVPTSGFITRTAGSGKFAGPVVRLHIGLEDVDDLTADLRQGLDVMRAYRDNPT